MTIIASIDFSAVTDRVFETAAHLAGSLNGRVLLLHVTPETTVDSVNLVASANAATEASAAEEGAARRLHRYEKRLRLDRLNVSTVMLRGDAASQIVEWCRRLGAGFLVIGSHGHQSATDRPIGETAESVLRHPPCPVIIVPHPRLRRTRRPWPARPERVRTPA